MDFKKGDKVSFLNAPGGGIITEIGGENVVVRDDEGFEWPYSPSELILRNSSLEKAMLGNIPDSLQKDIKQPARQIPREDMEGYFRYRGNPGDRDAYIEADLHIHELTDSNRNMSNLEMLRLQLVYFGHIMQIAREDRISKVVFIHGVGEGVLRAEIRKALDDYPRCRYRDADYRLYGTGATEVLLW